MKNKNLIFFLFLISLVFFAQDVIAEEGVCVGNIVTDGVAAQACAELAEQQAENKGYNVSCTAGLNYSPGTGFYYDPTCVINGSTGHSAYTLAGYRGTGLILNNINPGWETLKTELNIRASGGNSTNNVNSTAQNEQNFSGDVSNNTTVSGTYFQNAIRLINLAIANMNSVYGSIISSGSQKQIPSVSSSPSNSSGSSVSNSSTLSSGDLVILSDILPASFRYLKVDTSKRGWIAWREMEVYEKGGSKLLPVNATASCDWCNYGTPPSYSGGPKALYDGDPKIVWNAGETAVGCNWYDTSAASRAFCASSPLRTAWVQIDLGAVKNVNEIRLNHMGDSASKTEMSKILVSEDGLSYKEVVNFQESLTDYQWISIKERSTN